MPQVSQAAQSAFLPELFWQPGHSFPPSWEPARTHSEHPGQHTRDQRPAMTAEKLNISEHSCSCSPRFIFQASRILQIRDAEVKECARTCTGCKRSA